MRAWGRHADVEQKLVELAEMAEKEVDPDAAVARLQELHAAPIQPGLLAAAVAQVRDAGITTAVRVSPQNARALTPELIKAGIDLLVIHGTIISAEHVAHGDSEPLNLKTFISELDVPVIAGGVSDHRTALHLMRTGAAGVIVGYGSTEGATTTREVLGIGVPMATAIADAAGRGATTSTRPVAATCTSSPTATSPPGDFAKAIACGADAAVIGAPLAVAQEAPGGGWFWPSAAAHPSMPRGSLLPVSYGERPALDQVLNGPSDDPYGSLNFVGGLRRSMAKSGYSDLKEFQKVGLSVRA
ncbi:GuaB3 family IMP dehydrogenase-related protein [Rhodococcus hoagii]|nr:GuaB3 family IMP dehydrogenase-related protein [Prescottella equi]